MTALKIISIGNSTGILLPNKILAKLQVDKVDVLHVIETENGIELIPPMTLSLMLRWWMQKTSCAKIVISRENWLNDRADLDQFARRKSISRSAN